MKNIREERYDAERKVAVTTVDVTDAAQALARGHLAGPVSTYYLSKALAAVALLGAETSERDETVILQMKCSGPLGGINVECTSAGTLRGYTERKTLDDFDGRGKPDDRLVIGRKQIQVTRSVPGRIISQGISNSLDGYLAGSLQRKACIYLEAEVTDDVEVVFARGTMVEAMPDSKVEVTSLIPGETLDLAGYELKKSTPLSFACRCSPERAVAMLEAMNDSERSALPEKLDITCHMCGRIFTVKTR